MGSPSVYCKWQTNEQARVEVLYHLGSCSLAKAEEGVNTAQVTACGLFPPWYCLTEASLHVEEEQAASPAHLLCTIEVVVHWGRPGPRPISTTCAAAKGSVSGMLYSGKEHCWAVVLAKPHGSTIHFRTSLHSIGEQTQAYLHYSELPGLVIEVRVKVLSVVKHSVLCCCKFIISCIHIC